MTINPQTKFSNQEINFLLDVAWEGMGGRLNKSNLKKLMKYHGVKSGQNPTRPCDINDDLNDRMINYLEKVAHNSIA